ncbi:MAG: (2Fe-2S) ferredoxin domain-containing protein [Rhodospirillales bacterium]|nr:(2Fe-2S) ferredoxin domain-containing protein [Rhodospirillales bacterium]MBO6786824.1 (2Fe-2S) ferredoxin domain-containing protein [Rhodospirillales bacterium]
MNQQDPAPPVIKSVLICINRRYHADQPSCAQRGSLALADALEDGVRERKIDVEVERIKCLGQCTKGPTVRFAPGGRFSLGTSIDDVPDLLDELESLCGVRDDDDGPPLHLLGS